ncbi:RNI-like protein [Lyophyllum atratum]|nr:RNI-like protein [Lyophyllum atratum]
MSSKSSKRQRTGGLASFGAPSEADKPSTQHNIPSSSVSSTRDLALSTTPTLTTLCARVFATKFVKLKDNGDIWARLSAHLTALPDVLIPKLFAMLQSSCPTYLAHEVIVTYFLRGPSITLQKDLPGVKQRTIVDIARINPGVRELELTNFDDIPDRIFANLLRKLSNLRTLVLRGCTKVGAETMRAVAEASPDLITLNLNYTSVTPASVAPVVIACPHLKTDATLANFYTALPEGFQLPALRTLKLRQTSLSDDALSPILDLCPALRRLDLSFTLVRHPPRLLANFHIPPLQKLSLTSTAVSSDDLVTIVSFLPELTTLAVGALGASRGTRAFIGNTSAMTMNDDALRALTRVLEQSQRIENISLVGNTKLGSSSSGVDGALSDFITNVGRRCKKLNLASIPSLRSHDLVGLLPTEANSISPLETLILNNTGIDDEAGLYLAACSSLTTLAVAGTKMTSEGLFPVIDSCAKLRNLDVTSCRGIRVVDRRRFFEASS